MAKVGIFSQSPRKWFLFDEDTEVELEYIDKERLRKLLVKADDGAKKIGEKSNVIFDILLGKTVVHGWRKVKDPTAPGLAFPDGTPLPFSEDHRNLMMRRCEEFGSFVYKTATVSRNFMSDAETIGSIDPKLLNDFISELNEEQPPKN